MKKEKIKEYLRDIGLALDACHDTVTTDDVNVQPEYNKSWRVDHSKEIKLVKKLEKFLLSK